MIIGRQTKTADLAEKFRKELLLQRAGKDTPVMSVRELAEHFAVSTVTANRILNLLVEKDFLYRKPSRGTFIKNDPPVIPSIAYAGPLPDPENMNPVKYDAAFRLLEHFTELGIKPKLITFHTLRHPELATKELGKTNGLLIDESFIDEITLRTLWNYAGRIMTIGTYYTEEKLPCSQVIPDITDALLEFDRINRFDGYDKILLVRAVHRNSETSAESVLRVLDRLSIPEKKIGTVVLEAEGGINAYLRASRYFSRYGELTKNTLIVSMSEYFSQAIREIYSERDFMPDILNIDNVEGYAKNAETDPWFTAIDCQLGNCELRTLDLLCEQLKNPVRERTVLRLPANLIIRKSVKRLLQ